MQLVTWQFSCSFWYGKFKKVGRLYGLKLGLYVVFILLDLIQQGLKLGDGLVSLVDEL